MSTKTQTEQDLVAVRPQKQGYSLHDFVSDAAKYQRLSSGFRFGRIIKPPMDRRCSWKHGAMLLSAIAHGDDVVEVAVSERWFSSTVLGVGMASLFSDLSHETVTSVMPALLASMGAAAGVLGTIEAVSDGLSSLAKFMAAAGPTISTGASHFARQDMDLRLRGGVSDSASIFPSWHSGPPCYHHIVHSRINNPELERTDMMASLEPAELVA